MTQTQPQHQPPAHTPPGSGPTPAPQAGEEVGQPAEQPAEGPPGDAEPGVVHPAPPTYQEIEAFGYQRFTNREQSRLDFAARLLDLAEDDGQPLLERAKFLAIFSELLDEFYQIRVAALEDQVAAGVRTRSVDGLRPGEQLTMIRDRVVDLVRRQDHIFLDLIVPGLAQAGIRFASWSSLDDEDRDHLVEVFQRQIYPVLTPLAVDPGHPFPYISNLSLNLVVEVEDPASGEKRIARVKVPPALPRFVVMPDGERFVPLEQVISAHLGSLFPGMTIGHHHAFRVTRNADLALEEDEADDLLVAIEMELRRRRFGKALRLEVEADIGQDLADLLATELEIGADGIFRVGAPLDLSGLWGVYALDRPDLHGETWTPMTPPSLANAAHEPSQFFSLLRERDVLVHHPYDSFATSVEAFVAQAAEDPAVLGIKQTLYRTGGDSPIVASLIRAAENGKQVAAIVELKARFDEEANIGWARALEEVGVHVVYGIVGLKTHSKTALVLRREEDGVRPYCHVGTGNYNSKTARIYEDIGLLDVGPRDRRRRRRALQLPDRLLAPRRLPPDPRVAGDGAQAHHGHDRGAGGGGPVRAHRHEAQRADRRRHDRRAVPGLGRRRRDRPRRARPVPAAPRHPRALRAHPGALHRRQLPRAFEDLPLRRRPRRPGGRARSAPQDLHRLGGPHGPQPGPPDRGRGPGARRRAAGPPLRGARPGVRRRDQRLGARPGPALAPGAEPPRGELAGPPEGAGPRAGPAPPGVRPPRRRG